MNVSVTYKEYIQYPVESTYSSILLIMIGYKRP